jgi:circadian clock protein KaiB
MKKKLIPEVVVDTKLELQLFVSGMSLRSMEAIENIKRICEERFKNAFELEIIDIYKHPEIALAHHIVFCPSLIKINPLPKRTLIGNLSDTEKVVKALGTVFKR